MDDTTPDLDAHVIDLTTISSEQLKALGDSVLSHALRRLRVDLDHPQDVIVAEWNDWIHPPDERGPYY
jgi:hypothetical protein